MRCECGEKKIFLVSCIPGSSYTVPKFPIGSRVTVAMHSIYFFFFAKLFLLTGTSPHQYHSRHDLSFSEKIKILSDAYT